MRINFVARGALLVATVALSACAGSPSVDDLPPGANFAAKILADDTKLFLYSQRFMRPRDAAAEMDYATLENQRAARERDNFRTAAPKIAKKGLDAMLAQNRYCRAGYVVLEQYEERGAYIIRGECRDSATSDERARFAR